MQETCQKIHPGETVVYCEFPEITFGVDTAIVQKRTIWKKVL